jgi:hypothetical protein
MLAYLMGGEIDAPDSESDVGPFVSLEGVLRGAARTMLLLRDSYPTFSGTGTICSRSRPPPPRSAATTVAS